MKGNRCHETVEWLIRSISAKPLKNTSEPHMNSKQSINTGKWFQAFSEKLDRLESRVLILEAQLSQPTTESDEPCQHKFMIKNDSLNGAEFVKCNVCNQGYELGGKPTNDECEPKISVGSNYTRSIEDCPTHKPAVVCQYCAGCGKAATLTWE
jgi:hypothetical protein